MKQKSVFGSINRFLSFPARSSLKIFEALVVTLTAARLERSSKVPDARAKELHRKLQNSGFSGIEHIELVDVYATDAELSPAQLNGIAERLTNPVVETTTIDQPQTPKNFDWAIEVGFLPGVTDNEGTTVKDVMQDYAKRTMLPEEGAYYSKLVFLTGSLSAEEARRVADSLHNPVIQKTVVKSRQEFLSENGMGTKIPKVLLKEHSTADYVDLLDASDDKLATIGKKGIPNSDGTTRGPLALDLLYMKTIQNHFRQKGRNPTDVEIESIAQTWSEHCKHTIFADPIDDVVDGLFKTFIKGSTEKVREIKRAKGKRDFCVSVFKDNSGAIDFDGNYLITDKVETHNSPSALDPFGGAITGINGVNRDTIGCGLGAKPVINRYGFCFANPKDRTELYKGNEKGKLTQKMLSSRRIMDGVIDGVKVGGNCSGIPTPQGFMLFDSRYRGKPLVFVGTVGLIPRESAGRVSHEKGAKPGDYIVTVGGRVGKDGIHGATFSSEAMDSGSPATAVQIGDPITQKKWSDAIVKEARDLGLYNSITDMGAGGLSCAVAEMAKESGGFHAELDKAPEKYSGMSPWEKWISESQERTLFSVPLEKWPKFLELMKRRGVEANIIGEFTDSGKCIVDYKGQRVMDLEMDFLHDGLPTRPMHTTYTRPEHEEPTIAKRDNLTEIHLAMLARPNIASTEFIASQYDHEVQGGSVLKPLQGRGRVNGDATITRPVLDSEKGIVLSHGINPTYSDIDTYWMAACSIDTAVRNAVAAGANLDHLALLDNFCWCSSDDPERLGQLKAAVEACYETAIAYETPFISGKDSMFNDFKGFDSNGNHVKISVPPTLLVSAISVMDDSARAVSLDAKFEGDLVYVLGETHQELGGSEFYAMIGEMQQGKGHIGNTVPHVETDTNMQLYKAVSQCINEGLVASAQSVNKGGLAIALAKTAMGGMLGMDVSLEFLPTTTTREDFALYSESQGRLVVTVAPQYKERFEQLMNGNAFARIGSVRGDSKFVIRGFNGNKEVVNTSVDTMLDTYRATFSGF